MSAAHYRKCCSLAQEDLCVCSFGTIGFPCNSCVAPGHKLRKNAVSTQALSHRALSHKCRLVCLVGPKGLWGCSGLVRWCSCCCLGAKCHKCPSWRRRRSPSTLLSWRSMTSLNMLGGRCVHFSIVAVNAGGCIPIVASVTDFAFVDLCMRCSSLSALYMHAWAAGVAQHGCMITSHDNCSHIASHGQFHKLHWA